MLTVGRPFLPPKEEIYVHIESALDSGVLTHNGPIVQKFEKEVEKKLKINRYVAVTNGTLALQLAIKSLKKEGPIVIPAFTWVASAAACHWEGREIIWCDIDENTYNICVSSLEEILKKEEVACVMPVHVFGNPCEVEKLEEIAKKYQINVIYDAAHAFGSTWKNESVLVKGNISCTSTHATKILNTVEGGES